MEKTTTLCPICGIANASEQYDFNSGATFYKCDECFNFGIYESFIEDYDTNKNIKEKELELRKRANVVYAFLLRNPMLNHHYYQFFRGLKDEYVVNTNPVKIDVNNLLADYPKTILEKMDKALQNLAIKFPIYGYQFIASQLNCSLMFCETKDTSEAVGMAQYLTQHGYLTSSKEYVYSISVNGRKRLDEINKNLNAKKQGFVAMWFPDKSIEQYDFMCKVRESIRKAIRESGFEIMIIDEKEHNNQIVPEIVFEIKNSRFLVADITGHRNGVYYEAGIMEGLGRQVIVCCEKKDFEKKHFDVAQKSAIIYENEHELYERLKARIRATIEGANS